jgi:hypothetical protein
MTLLPSIQRAASRARHVRIIVIKKKSSEELTGAAGRMACSSPIWIGPPRNRREANSVRANGRKDRLPKVFGRLRAAATRSNVQRSGQKSRNAYLQQAIVTDGAVMTHGVVPLT